MTAPCRSGRETEDCRSGRKSEDCRSGRKSEDCRSGRKSEDCRSGRKSEDSLRHYHHPWLAQYDMRHIQTSGWREELLPQTARQRLGRAATETTRFTCSPMARVTYTGACRSDLPTGPRSRQGPIDSVDKTQASRSMAVHHACIILVREGRTPTPNREPTARACSHRDYQVYLFTNGAGDLDWSLPLGSARWAEVKTRTNRQC
ncbi:hypothetical protein RRG08_019802 [Elysia crispata]|uniref:Uncharacterized protein n=1 Tax=Elysia crispata TaxID=231223 RepID=A0AAE1AW90_9GAST|nr:hypothetical protein RRG08_019802 [Elysia crispata]